MDFNQSEFEKNLQKKMSGDDMPASDGVIDIDKLRIKDADDVPIYSYDTVTPRDRKAKLEEWEERRGAKKATDKEHKRRVPKSVIYISCVLVVSILFSMIAWFGIRDCFAFHDKVSEDIPVVVDDGEGLSSITKKLAAADVIDFPLVFRLYYKFVKKGTDIQSGTHYFRKSDDYDTILSILGEQTADRNTLEFLIAEGKTQSDIISIVSALGYVTAADMTEAINFSKFDSFHFLDNLPVRSSRLEGYLFPAKYEVYEGESATSIIIRMLKKFDSVFDDIMKVRAAELGMTVDEVVTLASVIQAEAGSEEEMPLVSSVFHNRLNDPSFGYLQSCATVQYTMSERKAVLSVSDIAVDNKYNTYKYPGLPVGPICNPGLAAIEAALYPADTDYYYFVSDLNGNNVFSVTYAEHLKAKTKLLKGGGTVSGTNITDE